MPTGDPEVPWRNETVAVRVWVDPSQTGGLERLGVIAHELIHLLGRNHVDAERFPETLMVAGGSEELSVHILHPLDREALHAVYGRLQAGTTPDRIAEALGPWSDASMHVRGEIEIGEREIAFGAALRNGLAQPWALGPTPDTDLRDNAALSGSVLWTGRLLGLTPHAETVAGAAELAVEHQQVVLGHSESADGCIGLQASMGSVPVVTVEPSGELFGSSIGVVVCPGVGPFAQGGLDEALGLSVGLWRVTADGRLTPELEREILSSAAATGSWRRRSGCRRPRIAPLTQAARFI